MPDHLVPKEGELYKLLTVAGHEFQLRYGYYDEAEREVCPPVVVFSDLCASPLRSPDGRPLVTQIQEPCGYYATARGKEELWCGDCVWFSGEHREIGVCQKEENRS